MVPKLFPAFYAAFLFVPHPKPLLALLSLEFAPLKLCRCSVAPPIANNRPSIPSTLDTLPIAQRACPQCAGGVQRAVYEIAQG